MGLFHSLILQVLSSQEKGNGNQKGKRLDFKIKLILEAKQN